jgi:glycosyltransferase involved in cell wall biosynthesis
LSSTKISILTTTYNQKRFLRKCINSVRNQTHQNYEHIILDDGSTDGTEEFMKQYKKDPKIIYVKREHVGMGKLKEIYNHGLSLAKGTFITILEADDFYPKNKLAIQLQAMKNPEIVLSFGKVMMVDADNKTLGINPPKNTFNDVKDWLSPLIIRDYIPTLTVMIKKSALEKIGGFHQPEGEKCVDYLTFLELARVGKFTFVNEVLGYWVKHGKNFSDSNLNEEIILVPFRYSICFCKRHNIPIPYREFEKQRGRSFFHIARHKLLAGKKDDALQYFKQSLLLLPIEEKAKPVLGMLLTKTNFNLEKIAKILKRPMEKF